MDINEADKVEHKVEDQWHYPKMIKYGWVPDTLTGIGFVRSYNYHHPVSNIKICVTTGFHFDYWNAFDDNRKEIGGGYWSSLEPFIKNLSLKTEETINA